MRLVIIAVSMVALAASVAHAQQQLSPSQIGLAQMAALADAWKAQADKLSAENADLHKENAALKAKCGEPCRAKSD
jgi:cell division protein FtsB